MLAGLRRGLFLVSLVSLVSLIGAATVRGGAMIPSGELSPNVNVSQRAGNQTETTVAVDPTNTDRVFTAANDETTNLAGLFAASSSDGGLTWTRTTLATGSDGFPAACCDASASWDSFGNLFLGYLALNPGRLVLLLSTDGGATWTNLGALASGGIDQPTVTTGAGSVWVTYQDGDGISARGAAVSGLGTANVGAFNAVQSAPGSSGGNFGDIAVGPSGQIAVTYESPSSGQGPATIFVNTDADGLGPGGFGPAVTATTTNVGGFDVIPPQPDRTVDAEAGLAWDRSGGPFNGRVYLVYTEEPANESNDTQIRVRHSDDNGATWSASRRVDDDQNGRTQFLPWISIDQSTGYLSVTWHDARSDNGADGNGANNNAELWGSFSSDGAATWFPNLRISKGISDQNGAEPAPSCCADIDYGDYRGAFFANGVAHITWADNSNSTGDNPDGTRNRFDIYTTRWAFNSCGSKFLARNDDGSTAQVSLPFTVDFFGNAYSSLYINNNGNVTFDFPLSTYTPFELTSTNRVMIAAFFGDVDTRNQLSGIVSYGQTTFQGRPAFCVNWDQVGVGYYNQKVNKLNKFQLLLADRSDVASGDFDIVFNYDQTQWETGDASGGTSGLGGASARVGYSNGDPAKSLELLGSGVNGSFLDSNTATGLIHNSRNSLVLGRYVFPVRAGAVPTGGTIFGFVGPGVQIGAPVQVCPSGGACLTRLTNASGRYSISGLPAGDYTITAFPPAGSSLLPATAGPVELAATATIQQDVTLRSPVPPPPGTTITSIGTGAGGVSVVYWNTPLTLSTRGCVGGTASYQVRKGATVLRSGTMMEGPAGTYTGTIAPLIPNSGPAEVVITILCPNPADDLTVSFSIYIDPSGLVRTPGGRPVAEATVTLFRSETGAPGSFVQVPDGSEVMDPSNRRNPDATDAAGRFGWNVIAGFYKVRAAKAGCHAVGEPTQAYAETTVLTIPPPALDLELELTGPGCPDDVLPPVTTATLDPAANAAGWNNHDVTLTLSAVDDPGGSGVASITYSLAGPAPAASRTVPGSTATIAVDIEGVHTITFFATDNAGNVEAAQTTVARLDKTDPTLEYGEQSPAPNGGGWNRTDVSFPFAARDALSGVASTAPAATVLVLTDEGGGVTGTVTVTDVAGNSKTFPSPAVKIDKTNPTVAFAAPDPAPNAFGWNNTDVSVAYEAADSLSGIESSAPASPLRFGDDRAGQARVVTATDVAGNSASFTSPAVDVDETAPRCTATATPPTLWPPHHALAAVAVTVESDDALSGVVSTVLASAASNEPDNGLGDGDTPNDVQGFVLGTLDMSGLLRAERSGDGSGRRYTLTYEVRDKAGNVSTCAAVVSVPHNQR